MQFLYKGVIKMPEKEKQLTPEQEKLQEKVRKEAEKEGLP